MRRIDLPHGRAVAWSRETRAGVLLVVACGTPYAVVLLISDSMTSGAPILAAVGLIYAVMLTSAFAADLLFVQFWTGGPHDRRRLPWLLLGVQVVVYVTSGLFVVATILVAGGDRVDLFGILFALPVPLFALGMMASLALAVFYRGALDPSLAIGKTTVYGLMGLVLAFAFGVAETFVERVVAVRTPLDASTADWLAGGFVAVLFAVLRTR